MNLNHIGPCHTTVEPSWNVVCRCALDGQVCSRGRPWKNRKETTRADDDAVTSENSDSLNSTWWSTFERPSELPFYGCVRRRKNDRENGQQEKYGLGPCSTW